jgi:phage tail-like protein
MSFSNTNYLYDHLPSRFRREDKDLFLKRFLQWFGDTLDDYDEQFDSFFESIDPETASETWIDFWLEQLFGWSWFPSWFTLAQKRTLYGNFARHLARRGTRRGIELFLLDFGIVAKVHARPVVWGEMVWGETAYAVNEPLRLVVEILFIKAPAMDLYAWGEGAFGEFFYADPKPLFTKKEILDLLRYQQSQGQEIIVVFGQGVRNNGSIVWETIHW